MLHVWRLTCIAATVASILHQITPKQTRWRFPLLHIGNYVMFGWVLWKKKGPGRRVKSKIPCKGKLGHPPKSSCTVQSTTVPTCSIRTRSLSKRSRSILSLSSFCLSISSRSLSLCRHSSRSCIIRIRSRSRSRRSRSAISLRLKEKKKEVAEKSSEKFCHPKLTWP